MDNEQVALAGVPEGKGHPLRNPAYRRWLVGNGISLLGDQFYLVALPWLVLERFGSAAMLGALMMVGAIPRAALLLVGGVATDRFSARWIMLITAVVRTLCVTATGVLVAHDSLGAAQMYALVIIFGIADAFAMPAQSAYLPAILPSEQLVAGKGLSQSMAQLTSILGPIPAGLLIAKMGVIPAIYIDAASFLFIIAALLRLPDPPRSSSHANAIEAIGEGIAYVMHDLPLRAMMLMALMVNLCVTGPLAVGVAEMVKTQLGSSASYGLLVSMTAAGGLAGAILASVWRIERRGVMILAASALLGACLAAIGVLPINIYSLSVILALIGCVAGFVNVHIGAWIMQRIEAAVRGRVSSVLILISLGAAPISMGLAGFAMTRSASAMFLMAGIALLCITALAAKGSSVRQIT
jgi:hypothetical protein